MSDRIYSSTQPTGPSTDLHKEGVGRTRPDTFSEEIPLERSDPGFQDLFGGVCEDVVEQMSQDFSKGSPNDNAAKEGSSDQKERQIENENGDRSCPKNIEHLQAQTENWRKYPGDPTKYHCGFDGYLEVRNNDSDKTPINECFYDNSGQLVDENHPYKGCRGTPDEYPVPDDWWNHPDIVYDHFVNDKGGPNGPSDVADNLGDEAYEESRRYFKENPTYSYPYADSPNPRDRKRKFRQW